MYHLDAFLRDGILPGGGPEGCGRWRHIHTLRHLAPRNMWRFPVACDVLIRMDLQAAERDGILFFLSARGTLACWAHNLYFVQPKFIAEQAKVYRT